MIKFENVTIAFDNKVLLKNLREQEEIIRLQSQEL